MKEVNKEKNGVIFNIQKFSVNDGPGIRTVVFLKGCPLHCQWCANPESQLTKIQVLWNQKKCVQCHRCMDLCSEKAVSLKDGQIDIDHARCSSCLKCIQECPGRALTSEGEIKTIKEIMDVIMQDLDFYEESNGGLTLSGGELLAQPEFSAELLLAAKEKGLHTCCETTGFTSPAIFQSVIENVDYILFDIKHWDCEKHKEGTGVTNELILENMKYAVSIGKTVLPRLPVIPGYNNSVEDAHGFVKRLQEIGLSRIQLLPFHQFGENKYDLLGETYSYADVPSLHREDLETFRKVFLDHGIDAFF